MTAALTIDWLKRAFKKIEVAESGCWQWQGKLASNGYVGVKINRKHTYLHRAFYATYKGPITDGMLVCHTCDNPGCVNPEHLFLGTHKDNMQDMKTKGRARGGVNQGKGQEQTRLTPQQVVEIYESTKQNIVLSVEYDVNTKTIYEIKSGKTWRKLTNGLVKGVPEFRVPAGFKLVPIDDSAATVPQVAQSVPSDEQIRADFEVFLRKELPGLNEHAYDRNAAGDYIDQLTQDDWKRYEHGRKTAPAPITSMDEWKAKYLPEHHRESLTLAQAMEFLTLGLQSAKQITTASNAGEAAQGDKS